MNYPAWKFWLDALQALGTALLGLYVWWTNREKVTAARFAKLEKEVVERVSTAVFDSHQQRLTEVETKLRNVPECCGGPHRDVTDRLNGHNDRLSQHKQLIDQLAGDVRHLPTTDDLAKVHRRVDEVFRVADSIRGEIKGIVRSIDLLLEHHLKER